MTAETQPNALGHFGDFGGQYVPETLMPALAELEAAYQQYRADPEFVAELTSHVLYYNERHRVKPGITGWAQLHYVYSDSIEGGLTKLQYDLYYLRNFSLLLDLFIVIQTVRVILWPSGAR